MAIPQPPGSPIFAKARPMQWPNGVQPEEDDWEFFSEAIKAWRSWRLIEHILDNKTSVIMLRSITYQNEWIPRQEMVAECCPLPTIGQPKPNKPNTHPAPDMAHGCGIYSVKTEPQALEWRSYRVSEPCVWGEVNIWGHVYKFTKGYLSEFAYPARLIVPLDLKNWSDRFTPEMLALELQETYGVEAVIQ